MRQQMLMALETEYKEKYSGLAAEYNMISCWLESFFQCLQVCKAEQSGTQKAEMKNDNDQEKIKQDTPNPDKMLQVTPEQPAIADTDGSYPESQENSASDLMRQLREFNQNPGVQMLKALEIEYKKKDSGLQQQYHEQREKQQHFRDRMLKDYNIIGSWLETFFKRLQCCEGEQSDHENSTSDLMCKLREFSQKLRDKILNDLKIEYEEKCSRLEEEKKIISSWLERFSQCLQCCEAEQAGISQQERLRDPVAQLPVLTQNTGMNNNNDEKMNQDTPNPGEVPSMTPGQPAIADTEGSCTERPDCKRCNTLMSEIERRDTTIQELKTTCDGLRSEAKTNEEKLANFKERMSIEASAEIGCRSNIFEDLNNPCRESELRNNYDKLGGNVWPIYRENVKKRKGETFNADKERETVRRMIKKVFDKALTDMEKKKHSLEDVFKISDETKTVNNKKQEHCMAMALQNLQVMILWENVRHYQTTNEELGHSDPDYLCELADQCYKQGCLMALHNPPLTLDWDNKEKCGPFPPVKSEQGRDGVELQ